jgi:hypothetical protein
MKIFIAALHRSSRHMFGTYMINHRVGFILFIVTMMALFTIPQSISTAQDDGLNLTLTSEYDIGFGCPLASALDPDGTTLWVLMNNCGSKRYNLQAYDVTDGTNVTENDYADALLALDTIYVDGFINPLAVTPEGDLSIRYNDPDTYESINLVIPLATDGEATTIKSDSYNALMAIMSEYPEFSTYSSDHTQVVASGGTSLHVVDVQAESEIVEIELEGSANNAFTSFSADGTALYVTRLTNPDDYDDYSATLYIYNLPDGELLAEYEVPSFLVWVSPDGKYAAAQVGSSNIGDRDDLYVTELESGRTSPAQTLLEEPHPVTTCLNTGADMTDVNFMTSGIFSNAGLQWLPDSSGLLLSLSYGGEAAGAGTPCYFNYSRLRNYIVEDAG